MYVAPVGLWVIPLGEISNWSRHAIPIGMVRSSAAVNRSLPAAPLIILTATLMFSQGDEYE
jgi:hypothetical protein